MNTPQIPSFPLIESSYEPIVSIISYDDLNTLDDDLLTEDEIIYEDEEFVPLIHCPGFGEMEEN